MFSDIEHQLLLESLRIFFLIGLPMTIGVMIVGFLAGVIQAGMSIREPVINYGIKVLVLGAILYLISPLASNLVIKLARLSLQ